jgi:hypothetical protein
MSALPCSHFGGNKRVFEDSLFGWVCSPAEFGRTILKASPRACKPPEQGLELSKKQHRDPFIRLCNGSWREFRLCFEDKHKHGRANDGSIQHKGEEEGGWTKLFHDADKRLTTRDSTGLVQVP